MFGRLKNLLRDVANVRVAALMTALFSLPLFAANIQWTEGHLVDVQRHQGFYYYRIIMGSDRYTGRSRNLYRLPSDVVQFAIHGSSL